MPSHPSSTLAPVRALLELVPVVRDGTTHLRLDNWCTHVPALPRNRPYLTRPAPGAPASPLIGSGMCGKDVRRAPVARRRPGDTSDHPAVEGDLCRRCETETVMALRCIQRLHPNGPLEATEPGTGIDVAGVVVALGQIIAWGLYPTLLLALEAADPARWDTGPRHANRTS